MEYFKYNGTASDTLGLMIMSSNTYDSPERDVTLQQAPGSNGDILVSNHRLKSVTVTYTVVLRDTQKNSLKLREKIQKIKDWLYADKGTAINSYWEYSSPYDPYTVLEDSYLPDYYREAYFIGPANWETMLNHYGTCELSFLCRPYLYYKDGLVVAEKTSGITSNNVLTIPRLNLGVDTPLIMELGFSESFYNATAFKVEFKQSLNPIPSVTMQMSGSGSGQYVYNRLVFNGETMEITSPTSTSSYNYTKNISKMTEKWPYVPKKYLGTTQIQVNITGNLDKVTSIKVMGRKATI